MFLSKTRPAASSSNACSVVPTQAAQSWRSFGLRCCVWCVCTHPGSAKLAQLWAALLCMVRMDTAPPSRSVVVRFFDALPCLALPCLALPCLALPCLAWNIFFFFFFFTHYVWMWKNLPHRRRALALGRGILTALHHKCGDVDRRPGSGNPCAVTEFHRLKNHIGAGRHTQSAIAAKPQLPIGESNIAAALVVRL